MRTRNPLRAMLGVKILDRYVIREFMVSYLIAIFVVLSLRVIMDLFVMFDEFVEGDGAEAAVSAWAVVGKILNYYGPQLLWYFRDFSGIIIVLASAFALVRMARNNEFTAVLSSGVSLKRLIAPMVLVAFGLNLLMVADQELLLPRLADKLVRKHDEVERRNMIYFFLLPDKDGSLLSAQQFDPEKQEITGLHVIVREEGKLVGQIFAERAHWDAAARQWVLEGGRYRDERIELVDLVGRHSFEDVPWAAYPSALSADYIWLQRHAGAKSLMSRADLNALLQRKQLKSSERSDVMREMHFRVADPIINMIMLLLGLPLLVTREQRNSKTKIFLVLLGSGGCFVATFACKLLAGELINPPILAAGLPILVFLPLSILALDGLKT